MFGLSRPLNKPWSGLGCFFRQCTEEKKIPTCAFCDDFPCEELERFYMNEDKEGKIKANILKQKELGLERWLDRVKENH